MDNQVQEAEKYYDLDKIVSISATARTISWLFLLVALLLFVPLVYTIASVQNFTSDILISIFFSGLTQVALSLVLVFFYVFLRAISEIIYLFLDIEEGINRKG